MFCIDRCTICIIGFDDNFYLCVACTITDMVPYFCILKAKPNTGIYLKSKKLKWIPFGYFVLLSFLLLML